MTLRSPRRPHVVPITAPSFPTAPRTNVYRNIAYSFIAFTVVIVLAVLWLSSARATVTIRTKRTPIQYDGAVDIARAPQPGQIPGRIVQGVFEKIQEFPVGNIVTTGTAPVPSVPTTTPAVTPPPSAPTPAPVVQARGTVKIINKYSRGQTLVRTTRLLTDDQKLYRIDRTIRIEAGQEVEVPVYADKPGAEFVIGPTRFTIPGLFVDLQKFIYAESNTAFQAVAIDAAPAPTPNPTPSPTPTPARSLSGKIVTQVDLDNAERILTEAVLEQAKRTLGTDLGLANPTVVYSVRKADRFKTNVSVGQSADTFLGSVKLDVTAVFYPKEDVLSLVRLKLKEKIPEGREFSPPANGDGLALEVQSADPKTEVANLHLRAEGAYRLTGSSPGLQKSVVAGKEPEEAVAILKSIEGVEDAQVTIKPKWFGKIPSLKDRIEIKIE